MVSSADLVAAGHALDVRPGDPQRDAVDGVVPAIVIEPHTPEAVAASLAWASDRGLSVLIEGAGTKRAWGRRPDRLDAILSMRKLNRVLAHRQGDLTVTVEAGMPLRELNATLAQYAQQLPLDPPLAERATVGGLLATNDSGPARHRFGTPRDLVIGIRLATTDGRLASAGGQVVKNVAGYDLSKLVCGSFGTIAVIVSATFKLAPLFAASRTLVIDAPDAATLCAVVDRISLSQLEPVAFECHVRGASDVRRSTKCLLRFASVSAAVDAQVDDATRQLDGSGATFEVLTGESESRLWRAYADIGGDVSGAETLIRMSWLPADLGRVLSLVGQMASTGAVEMTGRAGLGAGLLRLGGATERQTAVIDQLRQANELGNVVVTSASPALKAQIDVWGRRPNPHVLDALKRTVDPNNTLGAGRAF